MSQHNRRDRRPPPETNTFTNLERFAPVHGIALEILGRLERDFEVWRKEAFGLDTELERGELAHASISLTPSEDDAAPITMVFLTFPAVRVRVGRWHYDAFPACGCDYCDESLDHEVERLARLADNVTSGRFREAIQIPDAGDAWQETDIQSLDGGSSNRRRLSRATALQMLAGGNGTVFDWQPWKPR